MGDMILYPRMNILKTERLMESPGFLFSCLLLLVATCFLRIIAPIGLLTTKKKKLPPGPNGLPLIGNFITLGDRPHETIAKLANKHGPLMTLKLGLTNVVVASSAETAKLILLKNDQSFLGRPIPHAVTAETGFHLALPWLPPGPHWKKLRKICNTQIFTAQRLDALREVRNRMVRDMVGRVTDEGRDAVEGAGVLIGRLVFGTAVSLLSNSIFSVDMVDPKSGAMRELQRLNANIMVLVGKPNVADYFPFLKAFDPQGIRREVKVSYDRLHQLIDDMIDQRLRRWVYGSNGCGDLLHVLLGYTEEDGPDRLDRLDVKLLLMEMFIGGTDTTTTTVEWAMSELLHNPTILSKAKQKLSLKITPGKTVQEQDILGLPYLTAVIKETMRLHPIAPFLLPRRAEEDVEICGYTIPKHTQVLINTWSITRDTTHWEDPTVFKPERFLNSEILDFRGRDLSFIPFSAGRRICPGLNLAVRMVSLILATLVHDFDWTLPNGMAPEEMDMTDKFGVVLHKAEPLVAVPMKIVSS
ncbi:hypothetical protein DH2020_036132 [Rehmannia glutinosa]|uniref:Uncharacterized protein n=1 Tax=Rehmannia glutinosa TaxID=99300 RepID=A0ABR0V5A7_REHGL